MTSRRRIHLRRSAAKRGGKYSPSLPVRGRGLCGRTPLGRRRSEPASGLISTSRCPPRPTRAARAELLMAYAGGDAIASIEVSARARHPPLLGSGEFDVRFAPDSGAKADVAAGPTSAITRRCGSLLLQRDGLPPSTPCQSPGALRFPPEHCGNHSVL
jgi:hypothetical protein